MSGNAEVCATVSVDKKMLPWRDTVRGPKMLEAMFKLAIATGIHRKYDKDGQKIKAKQDERWVDFAEKLFQQSEFDKLDGSAKAVRNKFEMHIKERAKFHGWTSSNGGVTGNLSGSEGDLDAVDSAIRQILLDEENEQSERELQKKLSKTLETNEAAVLTKDSEKILVKRKKESTNPKVKLDETLIKFIDLLDSDDDSKVTVKKKKNAHIRDVEADLKKIFFGVSVEDFVASCAIKATCVDMLEEISLNVIYQIYARDVSLEREGDYFKGEINQLGVSRIDTHKLYIYLRDSLSLYTSECGQSVLNNFSTPQQSSSSSSYTIGSDSSFETNTLLDFTVINK